MAVDNSVAEKYKKIFHFSDNLRDGKVPTSALRENDPYQYQSGLGNHFESEAIPGTLPYGQNNPRVSRFELYTEQVTGSAFVTPRDKNKHSWLYRAQPSVANFGTGPPPDIPDVEANFSLGNPHVQIAPTQIGWLPFDMPQTNEKVDFVQGLKAVAGSGDPYVGEGVAMHMYLANASMEKRAMVNCDGELLIVPQKGTLDIQTEYGNLWVQPGEIVVIQRGQRFTVKLPDGQSRGYVQEVWGSYFELPNLGPLGSNSLASPRDFLSPIAAYDIDKSEWQIVYKQGGKFSACIQDHSPYDVVAWSGNYVPYKYDLTKFIYVGSISVDHIDPSIFCCLTAKSKDPITPLVDFLVVGPRFDVSVHTYRPPYYHRNCASELMGFIHGEWMGPAEEFYPGGLHFETGFVPHGLEPKVYNKATSLEPPVMKIMEHDLGFMFESSRPLLITNWAWNHPRKHDHDHSNVWGGLDNKFIKYQQQISAVIPMESGDKRTH
ncbi:homogentisate 1,2-dioxygenase [Aspergillus pseudoustus]|uniref:homogentisate 1,2-dioxygenase n=1 Tax=Aspergillus pseudoustus TaxID=1810923 RepID=A0ABR4KXI2_9EURO